MSAIIERFEKMLAAGQDTALLRFSLGNAYLEDDAVQAIEHFRAAVKLDSNYSAAWKMLGKALAQTNQHEAAITAFEDGIAVADKNGDKQAAKEMQVFLKRSRKFLD